MTPVALSHIGIPGSVILRADEYPKEGLGVYDDFETCDDFNGYVWATWTTMTAQPMQIDFALQALLNPSAPVSSGQKGLKYDLELQPIWTQLTNLWEAMSARAAQLHPFLILQKM